MSRLNPLYIILLFVTITFLSFYISSKQKDVYFEKIDETKFLQTKALEFKSLVNTWTNEKYINNTLDEILKAPLFANLQITRTATKQMIKIKIDSTNPVVLDNFLNRVLNKQLIIKKLELETNSINLEIGIK